MGKRNLGQGSMEFMVLSAILLFFLLIVLGVVADNTYYMNTKKEEIIAEDVIIKIQRELNLASRMLDGYSRSFSLPQKISGKEYTLAMMAGQVSLNTTNYYYYRSIPEVVGTLYKGTNLVNKTNGTIFLN